MWDLAKGMLGRLAGLAIDEGGIGATTPAAPVRVDPAPQRQAAAPATETTAPQPAADRLQTAGVARDPRMGATVSLAPDTLTNPDKAKAKLETEEKEAKQAKKNLEKSRSELGKAHKQLDDATKDSNGLAKDLADGEWDAVQKAFESFDNSLQREDAQALELLMYAKPPEPRKILAKIQELQPKYPELSSRFAAMLDTKVQLGHGIFEFLSKDKPLRALVDSDKQAEDANAKIKDLQDNAKPLEESAGKEAKDVEGARADLDAARKYREADKKAKSAGKEADELSSDLAGGGWDAVQKAFESFDNSLEREDAQALELLMYAKPPEPRKILARIQELQPKYPELSSRFSNVLDTKVELSRLGFDFLKGDKSLRDLQKEIEKQQRAEKERDALILARAPKPTEPEPAAQPTAEPAAPPAATQPAPPEKPVEPEKPVVPATPPAVTPPEPDLGPPTLGDDPVVPAPPAPVDLGRPPAEISARILGIRQALGDRPTAAQIDKAIDDLAAVMRAWKAMPGAARKPGWEPLDALQKTLTDEVAGHLPQPPLRGDGGKSVRDSVRWLQRALYVADLFDQDLDVRDIGKQGDGGKRDVDGRFGPETTGGLEAFQARCSATGRLADGKFARGQYDAATSQALRQVLTPAP